MWSDASVGECVNNMCHLSGYVIWSMNGVCFYQEIVPVCNFPYDPWSGQSVEVDIMLILPVLWLL